ncbi:plasmolipin [Achroia grisella]|uniref:plasmolipin n=1 Tax=Achroia grisella TaxID=688607 RepID=UPI0027D23212|nr:plasmolipin [Achroia grisella]
MFDNYGNQQSPQAPPPPEVKVLRFDKNYVKTLPGVLKLIQVICNLVGFICIKVSWVWLSAIFFNILYWFANVVTLLLLLMYTFHFVEKYDRWPWLKLEFFYCCVVVLAYICFSIFATAIGESVGYAVGFFGLCAIIAYGLDGYLKYRGWRRGLPPQ